MDSEAPLKGELQGLEGALRVSNVQDIKVDKIYFKFEKLLEFREGFLKASLRDDLFRLIEENSVHFVYKIVFNPALNPLLPLQPCLIFLKEELHFEHLFGAPWLGQILARIWTLFHIQKIIFFFNDFGASRRVTIASIFFGNIL